MLYKLALLGVLGTATATLRPDERPATCTQTKEQCMTALKTAAVCAANMTRADVFDKTTCCPTCKKNGTAVPAAQCTNELAKECIKDAPECGADEIPIREEGSCCRSCVDPKRKLGLRKIAACAKQKECTAAEETAGDDRKPAAGDKAFCPKCRRKRPRPTCDPECGEKQVCVKAKGNGTATKCVGKKKKMLKIKAKAAAKAFLKGATKEEVREMIVEMVERFCENAKNEEKCQKHLSDIREKLEVKLGQKAADGADVQVELSLPDEAEATTRRLLSSDGAMDLITEATADAGDSELEVVPDDTADAGDKDSAFVQGASLAVSVGLLLMVL